MNTLIAYARSGEVSIRLIERSTSNFVIVYDSPNLAKFQGWTTDRAHADRIFDRAVDIAEFGLNQHPAWPKPTNKRTITINGE
jgi:hypothetical protein